MCVIRDACVRACVRACVQVRTVCETKLNLESSRSHALFTLKLTQRYQTADAATGGDGTPRMSEKVSRVHLVDLAGSERAKRSGGHRIAETGAINKSLSTLGAVIHALAAGKRTHVPYRESALTYLLKDGLGGNARTVMLATVSPVLADMNETLSTLRYADSAKKIVNHATPNLDPSAKLVHSLKEEIDALRAQLANGGDATAIHEQLASSEKLMAEAQMTWHQKLAVAEGLAEQRSAKLAQMEGHVSELTQALRACAHAARTHRSVLRRQGRVGWGATARPSHTAATATLAKQRPLACGFACGLACGFVRDVRVPGELSLCLVRSVGAQVGGGSSGG
jgi:hypothetical protein